VSGGARFACGLLLSHAACAAMKAVLARGASAACGSVLAEHAVTLARAAMPPLVELSPGSKAACFKVLDAFRFTMEGLYAQP
jgi:hypothetical protein